MGPFQIHNWIIIPRWAISRQLWKSAEDVSPYFVVHCHTCRKVATLFYGPAGSQYTNNKCLRKYLIKQLMRFTLLDLHGTRGSFHKMTRKTETSVYNLFFLLGETKLWQLGKCNHETNWKVTNSRKGIGAWTCNVSSKHYETVLHISDSCWTLIYSTTKNLSITFKASLANLPLHVCKNLAVGC